MVEKDKGRKMISCFARSPNSLGYCGRESAGDAFTSCLADGCCDGVMEEVKNFIVLNPYLRALSKILNMEMDDSRVVEAYWIGNDELLKVKEEDYDLLLKMFEEQGVPSWLIDELKSKRPKRFLPTHLFQVLHVGVGRASGSVPYNIETINNCMIRWGKVLDIKEDNVALSLNSIQNVVTPYKIQELDVVMPYNELLVGKLAKGNVVAVHWNQVVRKLSKGEVQRLEFWTEEVLRSFD